MPLFMGPGGAYSPRYIYVDKKFTADSVTSVRLKRLLVTSEYISWHGKSMEFDRVSAFAFFCASSKCSKPVDGLHVHH
jgi:hypothetical protein